jgi:hypothetical protein
MKKNYENLISIIFKLLAIAFLIALLSMGFYFLGYLWKLLLEN